MLPCASQGPVLRSSAFTIYFVLPNFRNATLINPIYFACDPTGCRLARAAIHNRVYRLGLAAPDQMADEYDNGRVLKLPYIAGSEHQTR